MRNFTLKRYFGPETARSSVDVGLEAAKTKYPQLTKLGLSNEQIKARAEALAVLDSYLADKEKLAYGKQKDASVSGFFRSDNKINSIVNEMQKLRDMLLKPYDKGTWHNPSMNTWLNSINPDGSANLAVVNPTKITPSMFLSRFVTSDIQAKITSTPPTTNSPEANRDRQKLAENNEQSKEKQHNIRRFGELLLALERNDSDVKRDEINAAQRRLDRGDLEGAHRGFSDYFRKEYNIELAGAYSSAEALSNTFRKLKFYDDAARQQVVDTQERSINTDSHTGLEKELYAEIERRVNNPTPAEKQKTEEIYDAVLKNLPENSPQKAEILANPSAFKKSLQDFMIYQNAVETFVEKNESRRSEFSVALRNMANMK